MLYGVTPFRGRDAKETFEHILMDPVGFPHPLSEEPKPRTSKSVKDLIQKLLAKKLKSASKGFYSGASSKNLEMSPSSVGSSLIGKTSSVSETD